mgnify:CR=1 FL=1
MGGGLGGKVAVRTHTDRLHGGLTIGAVASAGGSWCTR